MSYGYLGNFGVTIGVHRYFGHKAFQVKPALKIFLLMLFAMCGQVRIITPINQNV